MDPSSDSLQKNESTKARPLISNRLIVICLLLECAIGMIALRHIPIDLFEESDWRTNDELEIPVADFMVFHAAGTLASNGDYESLYDRTKLPRWLANAYGGELKVLHFSYPPTTLLFLEPFSKLELLPAWRLWVVIGVSLMIGALFWLTGRWLVVPLVLFNPFVLWALLTGQMVLILAPLMVMGYLLHRRGYQLASGMVFGLLIAKPQLALALPIIFLWTRQWRTIIGAALTIMVIFALTWLAYGPDPWAIFMAHGMENAAENLEVVPGVFYRMMTPTIYATLFGAPQAIVILAQIIGICTAIWLTYRLWITAPKTFTEGHLALLVIAPALISPYLVDYDLMGLGIVMVYCQLRLVGQLQQGQDIDMRAFAITLVLLVLAITIMQDTLPLQILFPPLMIGLLALLLSGAGAEKQSPHGMVIGNS